ncbi:MAG TPA: hypothetical protein EYN58_07475 [Candidatus Poseidoniales archaeon]|jgi:hypothetical protein|nr:MAG: hypothetical protein CXX81_28245 [Euryarchaeota archaeon]HHZ74993.1 hypothetical protein [Candidatus Poseidoniales archaeon]PXY74696.1 MAG: hypothetical protein CXX81_20610 [Euryarchaeota archaeon]PXY78263.1 MAG: hypothetical protein CXX81_08665 [Euryarchaeota archaeon]PXY78772.1 MAG: hypothetical protein CXX81_06055 [Euryarchaeota archaeon]
MQNGLGSQKQARRNRLKSEIMDYVSSNPNCTASEIVASLANDRRMKNHGLTPRKVGFFIPRYCKEILWNQDTSTGKRVYVLS